MTHNAKRIVEDLLPGGAADGASSEEFDPSELAKGIEHESEHTDDEGIAREIAMDHLSSSPTYYSDLEKANLEACHVEGVRPVSYATRVVNELLEGNTSSFLRARKEFFDLYHTGSFQSSWNQLLSVPESQWRLIPDGDVRGVVTLAGKATAALKGFLSVLGPMVVRIPTESLSTGNVWLTEGASAGMLVNALEALDQILEHPTTQRTLTRVNTVSDPQWGHLPDSDLARATNAISRLSRAFRELLAKGVPLAQKAAKAKPTSGDYSAYDSAAHAGASNRKYGVGAAHEPEPNWGNGGWDQ